MAHLRKRYLVEQVKKALSFSPLVGVIGQRQVGKTTLLTEIVRDAYVTMDDEQSLAIARAKPQGYLENFRTLTAIDECQKAPELFSALKLRVQKNKRSGQFLLSGSIRFTSRRAIQESLTGRIFNLELLPMTLAESHGLGPFDYQQLFTMNFEDIQKVIFRRCQVISKKEIDRYLMCGGLPGICFQRDQGVRQNKFNAHLQTLLQRDINLIIKTTVPYESLFSLMVYLAENQGEPFSLKDSARVARLSQNTVKKLLAAFEGLFLIRRVQGFGFRSAPSFFLEDQGMAFYLMTDKNKNKMIRFLFSQIFSNTHYTHQDKYQIGYFENKSGLKVDLVIRLDSGDIGFVFEDTEAPSHKLIKTAESFLSNNNKAKIVLLTAATKAVKMDKNMVQLPVDWIV